MAAVSASPASTTATNLPVDTSAAWRTIVAELRAQKKELLASALAHGRVLSFAPGQVRLGFSNQDGMYRRQVERALKDAQATLHKVLGVATALVLETVAASTATPSLAEEESERVKAREEQVEQKSREHPAVLAALRIFGGTIEQIRVLDEQEPADEQPAEDCAATEDE